MRRTLMSPCALLIAFLATTTCAAFAQNAAGSVEAAGTAGYAHFSGLSDSHFILGASAFYNFNKTVAVGFEYTYASLGSENLGGVNLSGHKQSFGGAGRFSMGKSRRVVPYFLAGFGGVTEKGTGSAGGFTESSSPSGYYYAIGGGASLFASSQWGVRPEFRYERQQFDASTGTNAYGQNDVQVIVSAFYQFGR